MKNLQIAIPLRAWLRRLLGVLSIDEVEATAIRVYADNRADIERAMAQLRNREDNLKATEARINARFRELEAAEEEMKRVAYGVSVTIYDLVQAVQIEHGAVGLMPEGKAILAFDGLEGDNN